MLMPTIDLTDEELAAVIATLRRTIRDVAAARPVESGAGEARPGSTEASA
jgi:hypothetical protein